MACLLYTSDAADDSLRVDLGGRRIIKKIGIAVSLSRSTHSLSRHIHAGAVHVWPE